MKYFGKGLAIGGALCWVYQSGWERGYATCYYPLLRKTHECSNLERILRQLQQNNTKESKASIETSLDPHF